MLIRKAFKFRIRLTPNLRAVLSRWGGSCRWLWNRALAGQKERLAAKEKLLGYNALSTELTALKQEFDWLYQTPHHSLQHTLKHLDRAFKDWRGGKKGFPHFKKRSRSEDSIRFPVAPQLEGDRAKLPKIGWIRFRKSLKITGTVKNATITRQGKHWFISFQTEQEVEQPFHSSQTAVGIDLGVTRFATLSNGKFFEPFNSFKKLEKQLAGLQRSLSRKVKFSNNWRKAREKVNKLHHRVGNARNDYLHKISTALSKNHAIIVVEDLEVRNLSKSAKGTKENPGKGVKAKSGLNKRILDQGWHEFRRQLEYKSEWFGGKVVAIDPRNTSRRCQECGHTAKDNRRTQAGFHCQACGHEAHADENAAKNILQLGLESLGLCQKSGEKVGEQGLLFEFTAAGHAVEACGDAGVPGRRSKNHRPGFGH